MLVGVKKDVLQRGSVSGSIRRGEKECQRGWQCVFEGRR